MNPQRRFAPNGGLLEPESVAGLARIRKSPGLSGNKSFHVHIPSLKNQAAFSILGLFCAINNGLEVEALEANSCGQQSSCFYEVKKNITSSLGIGFLLGRKRLDRTVKRRLEFEFHKDFRCLRAFFEVLYLAPRSATRRSIFPHSS